MLAVLTLCAIGYAYKWNAANPDNALVGATAVSYTHLATLISQLFNLVFIVIGFVVCNRRDGDKPVLSLRFKKITIRDYLVMICLLYTSRWIWRCRNRCGLRITMVPKRTAMITPATGPKP